MFLSAREAEVKRRASNRQRSRLGAARFILKSTRGLAQKKKGSKYSSRSKQTPLTLAGSGFGLCLGLSRFIWSSTMMFSFFLRSADAGCSIIGRTKRFYLKKTKQQGVKSLFHHNTKSFSLKNTFFSSICYSSHDFYFKFLMYILYVPLYF